MTKQMRNKILGCHSVLKPYYNLTAIVLSTVTLNWEVTHVAFSVIIGDTKELHTNTAAVTQQRKDILDLRVNTAAAFGILFFRQVETTIINLCLNQTDAIN